MYRYGPTTRNSRSRQQQTLLLLVVLVLLIVCVALAYVYSTASRINANTRSVVIARMQAEVTQAKTSAYQLSQTGGSMTASMIAIVRQHVYAAHTINEMTAGIYGAGNVLVGESYINSCISLLGDCDEGLQGGVPLADTFTKLRTAIDDLLKQAAALE